MPTPHVAPPAYTVTETELRVSVSIDEHPAAFAAIKLWLSQHDVDLDDVPRENHIVRDVENNTVTLTRDRRSEPSSSPVRWVRHVVELDRPPAPFPDVLVRWPDFPGRAELAEQIAAVRAIAAKLRDPLEVPPVVAESVGSDAIDFAGGALQAVANQLDQVVGTDRLFDVVACRGCGCTDDRACVGENGACWWVESDLCSACASTPPAASRSGA